MKKVVTIILAVILAITFVNMAVTTVVSGSIVSMVDTDRIVSFVQTIDYKEIITSSDDINDILEEYKVKDEAIEDILKSDAVEEVIDIYAEGLRDFIKGSDSPREFTADDLKDIVEDNIDELVEIANEHMTRKIDEDELRDRIFTAIDENAEEIVEVMPSVDQVTDEVDSDLVPVLQLLFDPMVTVVLAIITVLVAVLLFLCRIHNAEGFLWIGIASAISVIVLGILVVLIVVYLQPLALDMVVGFTSAIGVAFESVYTSMGIGIGILALISVLAIIAYFIFRNKILPDNHSYVQVGVYNK